MSEVKPGQVWADMDKRSAGRHVRIVAVEEEQPTVAGNMPIPARALVEEVALNAESGVVTPLRRARQTRIRLDRFRPNATGYRLIQDA